MYFKVKIQATCLEGIFLFYRRHTTWSFGVRGGNIKMFGGHQDVGQSLFANTVRGLKMRMQASLWFY